ncbi:MAG: cyclic nucleotide-binding domain-containing protein [Mariprofundales bacterium]
MNIEIVEKAIDAANKRDFLSAHAMFSVLVQQKDAKNDIDIMLHHAYCAARIHAYTQAISAYGRVAMMYEYSGESGAAIAIHHMMERLRDLETKKQKQSEDINDFLSTHQLSFKDPSLLIREQELIELLFCHERERDVLKGEILCKGGDISHAIWLLLLGKLDIIDDDDEIIAVHCGMPGKACIVGEMGFFTGLRRSASIVAQTNVRIAEVRANDMDLLLLQHPGIQDSLAHLFRERICERMLAKQPIFERMQNIDRKRLALAFEEHKADAGHVLITPQQSFNGACLLTRGCMFLLHNDELVCGVHPGDLVHPSGLLDDFTPEYSLVAATQCSYLHLSHTEFMTFTKNRPWLLDAIRIQSTKPVAKQVLHPEDTLLGSINRYINRDPKSAERILRQ